MDANAEKSNFKCDIYKERTTLNSAGWYTFLQLIVFSIESVNPPKHFINYLSALLLQSSLFRKKINILPYFMNKKHLLSSSSTNIFCYYIICLSEGYPDTTIHIIMLSCSSHHLSMERGHVKHQADESQEEYSPVVGEVCVSSVRVTCISKMS